MNIQEAKEDAMIDFLSDDTSKLIWDEICESTPSDHISLNHEEDIAICSLWQKDATSLEFPPADIFFAGTIPLLDCIISVDESDCVLKNGKSGFPVDMRIVIYKDYKERIAREGEEGTHVGCMIQTLNGRSIIYPICAKEGFNYLFTTLPATHNFTQRQKEIYMSMVSQAQLCRQMQEWMTTWYGIQIALLHPMVKTIFEHPTMERIYNPSADKRKGKHITCYIKKHVIKTGDVKSALHENEKNFTRKTMAWYVIGHWRNYSNGRKIFIRPYWKGPLREMKRNLEDAREREIAISEEKVANA